MRICIFRFSMGIYKSYNKKFSFMNNRIMNARMFWFLTKNKTIIFTIPMPKLYFQTWNKEKCWEENHPTKYKLFLNKLKKIIKK